MVVETTTKNILDLLTAGITISGVDLDIRDLNVAQDEVKAVIRADTAANQTNDLKITLNGEDVNVTATNLDIRDLTSASDSVEVLQDTFADLKTEVHPAAGEIFPTGIYGYDGSSWETLNTDTNNRLLTKPTQTTTKQLYTYSFNEYLADNGTLRAGSNVASDSTVTLYTVPGDTVFYITSASLQNRTTAADSGGNATLEAAGLAIIDMESVDVADSTEALCFTPTIPIKLTVGQLIQVVSSTEGNRATGTYVGYEVAV